VVCVVCMTIESVVFDKGRRPTVLRLQTETEKIKKELEKQDGLKREEYYKRLAGLSLRTAVNRPKLCCPACFKIMPKHRA